MKKKEEKNLEEGKLDIDDPVEKIVDQNISDEPKKSSQDFDRKDIKFKK